MSKALFVGVDVSKAKLDISFTFDGAKYDTLSILNNEQSILGFFDYLQSTFKNYDFYFGYEATSNYMHILQKLVYEHNFKQIMINPYIMAHYLKHLNARKKTDKLDSVGITKFIQGLDQEDFKTVFNQDNKTL